MKRIRVGVGFGLLVSCAGAAAQTSLWEVSGDHDAGFGRTLAVIGDVSGDGIADVAVGELSTSKVRVRDGAAGAFLFATAGHPLSGYSLSLEGLGDVDGDGVPDFGVGAPWTDLGNLDNAGVYRVLSGVDGSVLIQVEGDASSSSLGEPSVALGDVDLDGFADFAYTHRLGFTGQAVVAHSGANGQVLAELRNWAPNDGFGRGLAAGGDIDGDGVGDLAIAAPNLHPEPGLGAWSGASLAGPEPSLLYQTTLTAWQASNISLAMPGDLDGDGSVDVAVGSSQDDIILVVDDQGRETLLTERLFAGCQFALDVTAAGDVDGDGVGDLLTTGSDQSVPGLGELHFALVVSGADGRPLHASLGAGWAFDVGAGDFDADGTPDLVASYRKYVDGGESLALVRAVSGRQGRTTTVAEACGDEALGLTVLGDPAPGGRLAAIVEGPLGPAVLVLGLPHAPTLLPGGCAVHVAPVFASAALDLQGQYLGQSGLAFSVPTTAGGFSVAAQVVRQGADGAIASSNAVVVRIAD